MPFLSHDVYAAWVATQIFGDNLDETPGGWLRKHRDGWHNVFSGIVQASGVLELPALVISRWEFLGSLYRGNIDSTGCLDAVVFAKRFLERVNHQYSQVHNLTGRPNQQLNQSDMFMMIRNKPLHGANPAGIETDAADGVATWRIGPGPTGHTHLALDQQGSLHVDGTQLYEELLDAMTLFAEYLDQNTERQGDQIIGNHLPACRWNRAFWGRFKPHAKDNLAAWMMRGVQHGIPV